MVDIGIDMEVVRYIRGDNVWDAEIDWVVEKDEEEMDNECVVDSSDLLNHKRV